MAATREDIEVDSLASLEERVTRAVEMVTSLRRERDQFSPRGASRDAEIEAARRQAAEAQAQASKLAGELEQLRGERKQVRTRIEKLLGQMDLLSES